MEKYKAKVTVSKNVTDELQVMKAMGEAFEAAMLDAYEDMWRPREGPRRRRVFILHDRPQVPADIESWAETVIELVQGSEDADWSCLPDWMQEKIGRWDWEYLPPMPSVLGVSSISRGSNAHR